MQIADRSATDYFLRNSSVVNPDRSVYLWAGAYTSFAGDQPAVRYTSTTLGFRREYPITDHLGSIRVVLTPDERQSIVSRSDYEPFGAPLSNGRERLSFIGKEQDNESALGDYGVRKYDPSLGRFMSVDALSDLMPGSSPFHYCFNNPLILRDPSGLVPGVEASPLQPGTAEADDEAQARTYTENKERWNRGVVARDATDRAPRPLVNQAGGTASGAGSQLDDFQLALDIAGIFDPTPLCDAFNAGVYAHRSQWANAGISVLGGLLPYVGDVAKMFRGIFKGEKVLYDFSRAAARHMADPNRMVPIQVLDQVIKGTKGLADPGGSRALMHYSRMWRNGKQYNVEVLHDATSNSIWHFQYDTRALGPLPAIK